MCSFPNWAFSSHLSRLRIPLLWGLAPRQQFTQTIAFQIIEPICSNFCNRRYSIFSLLSCCGFSLFTMDFSELDLRYGNLGYSSSEYCSDELCSSWAWRLIFSSFTAYPVRTLRARSWCGTSCICDSYFPFLAPLAFTCEFVPRCDRFYCPLRPLRLCLRVELWYILSSFLTNGAKLWVKIGPHGWWCELILLSSTSAKLGWALVRSFRRLEDTWMLKSTTPWRTPKYSRLLWCS